MVRTWKQARTIATTALWKNVYFMNCENCGACCTQILFHASGKIDMAWLTARHGRLVGQAIIFPNLCLNYDAETKRCKIYENRPFSCRAFKIYCKECLLCRKAQGLNGFSVKREP